MIEGIYCLSAVTGYTHKHIEIKFVPSHTTPPPPRPTAQPLYDNIWQ